MTTRMLSSIVLVVCCFLQFSQAKTTCEMRVITPFFEDGQQDKTGEDCRAGDRNGRWTAEGCTVSFCKQEEYWTGTYTCLEEVLDAAGKFECRKKEIECCGRVDKEASGIEIAALVLACIAVFGLLWISVIVCMIRTPKAEDIMPEDGYPMPVSQGAPLGKPASGNDLQTIYEAARQGGHVVDITGRPTSTYYTSSQ